MTLDDVLISTRPILRARSRRRRRQELKEALPALAQGFFLAGAAVLLLLAWVRFAAPGMLQ